MTLYNFWFFIHTPQIFDWHNFCSGGGLIAFADNSQSQNLISDSAEGESKKKKVVVLGTGWAGTSFLKNLKSSSYDVHIVSPRNYFAFTPLLPSVTNGTVEARSVVEPIRNIVRKVGHAYEDALYLFFLLTFHVIQKTCLPFDFTCNVILNLSFFVVAENFQS